MSAAEPVRLLFVAGDFPASESDPSHSFVRDQAIALAKAGAAVDLVVLRSRFKLRSAARAGTRPSPPAGRNDLRALAAVAEVPLLVPPGRVDLVWWTKAARRQLGSIATSLQVRGYAAAIVHDEVLGATLAPLLARHGIPWILVQHGRSRGWSSRNRRGMRVLELAGTAASRVVAVGEGLEAPGWLAGIIEVVPNGVTIPVAERVADRPPGTLVISVGNLEVGKGIDRNLMALSQLVAEGRDVAYWIVGDGPLRRELTQTARDLGVANRVTFFGTVDRARIGGLLSACDFFSLPSSPEAFGLAHLEAAGLGKAVVACRGTGPAANLPGGVASILVPAGDAPALADAWRQLCDDRDLRARLGRAGAEAARSMSWEMNARTMLSLVASLQTRPAGEADRPARVGWLFVRPEHYVVSITRWARERLGWRLIDGYQDSPGCTRLLAALAAKELDAVIVEGWSTPRAIAAMALARLRGVPYLVGNDTFRRRHTASLGRRLAKALVIRVFVSRASVLLPGGTPQAGYMTGLLGEHHPPVRISRMTVDLAPFRQAAASMSEEERDALRTGWGGGKDDLVVLYVGRLLDWKGLSTLMDAAHMLAASAVAFRVVVVGDGIERSVVDRATASGLPVTACGSLYGKDVADAMAASDVLVLPSFLEPWGLVVNEAMAAGLPVVASDGVGSVGDLVADGETGLVFPAGDATALCRALSQLAACPDLRARLATAGRARVSTWDLGDHLAAVSEAVSLATSRQPGDGTVADEPVPSGVLTRRSRLKRTLAPLAATALDGAVPTGRTGCTILCYHGVSRNGGPGTVAVSALARQLDHLATTCEVVSVGKLVRALVEGTALSTQKPPVALTFDDGYRSVVEYALPLLVERELPATAFLVAGHMGGVATWAPEMEPGDRGLWGEGELAAWIAASLEVGSHSMTHPDLTLTDPSKVTREVVESREVIASLGGAANGFCYPYGHVSPRVAAEVEAAGYSWAVAGGYRRHHHPSETFALGRMTIDPSDGIEELRLKLAGGYDWLQALGRARALRRRLRAVGVPRPARNRPSPPQVGRPVAGASNSRSMKGDSTIRVTAQNDRAP